MNNVTIRFNRVVVVVVFVIPVAVFIVVVVAEFSFFTIAVCIVAVRYMLCHMLCHTLCYKLYMIAETMSHRNMRRVRTAFD